MNLADAIECATFAHDGQLDKGGAPYIEHPLAVMDLLADEPEDVRVVAVLHDVLEDTDVVPEGLTDAQAAALDAISRRPHPEETYREYVERVAANDIARKVKVADVRHNLSPSRAAALEEGERKGLEKRYSMTLKRLGATV